MEDTKIKILIIDGEPTVRNQLRDQLEKCFPELGMPATASSGKEGLQQIATCQPDLVFLDVEMADMTGLEMLAQLAEISFQVVFLTPYNHAVRKTIRFNSLEFLVKPIDSGAFKRAVAQYAERSSNDIHAGNIRQAITNMQIQKVSDQILCLHTQDGGLRLILKDIIRIEGERDHSFIFLSNHQTAAVSKSLGDMEELLNDKGFYRCHKSYLINMAHIISRPNSISLLLSDQTTVPLARRKNEDFAQRFTRA